MRKIIFLSFIMIMLTGCYNQFAKCQRETGCGFNYCNTCQCTDPGFGRNECISDSDYCTAFGNVGSR